MKSNKKLYIIVLLVATMLTTGCGSNNYITDKKGKIVTNSETGQSLQKTIYCKPSEKTEMYKLYEKYEDQMDIKLSSLPNCDEYSINSNKTNSLWQFLFVKPLAYIILKLGLLFKNMGMTHAYLGLSVILIGLLIRIILLPLTIKTQTQSERIKKATPELQRLEKKYGNDPSQEAMLAKQQEMMMIYKKYQVNPMLSCIMSLIQLPLFFAFLEAIYKIPAIYEGRIFGWNLGTTPSIGIFKNHQYTFIILIALIILSTYFSFKFTMKQAASSSSVPGAEKQTKFMLIFMTVFIGFASLSLPTAIALYWIVTYAFMIVQTYIIKFINEGKTNKKISKKKKSINEKLKVKENLKYGKNK